MGEDLAVARALDLVECLLEEVAQAEQNWKTVERLARELAELAASTHAARLEPSD